MPQVLGKEVGPTGFGLMGMTWRANPQPFEKSIATMRRAVELGANAWNGGEIYGTPEKNSLHLLRDYFARYPEDADKVVLCIKGATKPGQMAPDGSPENVARSINECVRLLGGAKKLDLFECARVDPGTPIETTIAAIAEHVRAGKVGGISLSEVSAATIRRAAAVHPIAAVEVEVSLFSPDIFQNGVAAACAELGIPIFAYSPMCRGFLTGEVRRPEDIPEGDVRHHMPRFQGDAFYENLKLVAGIEKIAAAKGCKPSQVALAWVRAQSGRNGNPTIIPIPGTLSIPRLEENMAHVDLTEQEIADLDQFVKNIEVVGGRYGGPGAALMNG
ncbi:NADP-dependent oxidoreductase domain-containing protein [Lineolata rhizophorae]|uniref:NADP-dependent oxidoreductase domain-containing protein n=1 Tax=Lineolata rhizophorae TaxID=578093 RepID=A0A6A6NL17_9PEZI|nr:NADP-dependent oxidoreductase domain-containing protein [Lineolata rhizophorae]